MSTPLPPVVLLHGWGGSAADFATIPLADRLRAMGRQVISIPMPGHAREPQSHDPEHYAAMDVLLETTLPDRVVDVVGFSLGGKTALVLAARALRRFRRIVVCGVGENIFGREDGERAAACLMRGPDAQTPPLMQELVRSALATGNDPGAMAAVIRRPLVPPTPELLARVRAPVLLVVSDADLASGSADPLHAALPGARVITVRGVGHAQLPYDEAFTDAAAEFLSVSAPDRHLAGPGAHVGAAQAGWID